MGVFVGVMLGVRVGVSVGVAVGVLLGVLVGVLEGVFVGVSVGVAVGVLVDVGPLSELTTSPAELPFRFQVAKICPAPPDELCKATLCGELLELTVVADDQEEYGLEASEYFTLPESINHEAILFVLL